MKNDIIIREKYLNKVIPFVVSMDDFSGNTRNGIKHIQFHEFLTNC